LFLWVPVFTVFAAHWRAGSSDVPCSWRTVFSGLVTNFEIWVPYKSLWTAFEWIDRNLESSIGTDTFAQSVFTRYPHVKRFPNRSFWTALKKCCKGLSIVPAFFALASSCFRNEDLTLGTISRLRRFAWISQIWIRLRSVWTSARISFFIISDGAWWAADAVRQVVVVKRESSIIADAPFQLRVPFRSFWTVFIKTTGACSEPCWFDW